MESVAELVERNHAGAAPSCAYSIVVRKLRIPERSNLCILSTGRRDGNVHRAVCDLRWRA